MTHMSASHAREVFAELVNRTAYGKERVVLTRRGKRVAVLVPVEDLRLLEEMEDRLDVKAALAAEREAKRKGEIPLTLAEARRRAKG